MNQDIGRIGQIGPISPIRPIRPTGIPMKKHNIYIGGVLVILLTALFIGQNMLDKTTVVEGAAVMAPRFEVDPLWPKPLPNHWYIGMSIGVACDAQDHVWIVHRPDTVSANEAAADQKTGH